MALSAAVDQSAPTRFSLAGGFAIAVVLASMLHAPDVVAQTGPLNLFGLDKWIHFGSYATIAFLLAYASLARSTSALLAIAAATVLFGVAVELIQGTIAWRTQETADVVANAAGTIIGLVVWRITWARLPVEADQGSTA